jgi:hypothetical protein
MRQSCPSGQAAGAGEAVCAVLADDDVVWKFDAEDFTSFGNAFGELDIFTAWSRVA